MKRSGPLKRRTPLRNRSKPDNDWAITRQHVIDRDRVCQAVDHPHVCGMGWHVHHVKRRSQGGTNDLWNLVLLCGIAHAYVHDHPAWARSIGLLA